MRITSEDGSVTNVVLSDGLSIASSMVNAAIGVGGYQIASSKGVNEVGSAAIGAGIGAIGGAVFDKGSEYLKTRYVPNKTDTSQIDNGGPTSTRLNAAEDRYKKMWDTRRRLYGKTGRKD